MGRGVLRHRSTPASTCSSPAIFDFIREDEVVDFSGDVFPAVLDDGDRSTAHVADGYWEDVGTLEAYLRAHQDVLDGRVDVDIDGFRLGEGIWLGRAPTSTPPPASRARS